MRSTTNTQQSLLEFHRDVAKFSVTAEHPFFWVLDLEDDLGFCIASQIHKLAGNTVENLADRRDATRETGAIPALTMVTTLENANNALRSAWNITEPLAGGSARYMGIVSDGRLCVILL